MRAQIDRNPAEGRAEDAVARNQTWGGVIRALAISLSILLGALPPARAADGLVVVESPFPAKETMDRAEAVVRQRNLIVFARIDHAAGAAKIGKVLRPTELLMFGHPKGGTPFMECAQTVGIDLPLKLLVWEDAEGRTWLGYNDPGYLAQRHGVADCPAVGDLRNALATLTRAAVSRESEGAR
jgi:uncharacterized protein (DUF302 family)